MPEYLKYPRHTSLHILTAAPCTDDAHRALRDQLSDSDNLLPGCGFVRLIQYYPINAPAAVMRDGNAMHIPKTMNEPRIYHAT